MKHIIILVGLPGSGKSTLCKNYPDYVRINQDEQGKVGHTNKLFDAFLMEKDIIIDRCNFSKDQRARYIRPAKSYGYTITIIYLRASARTCIERINKREEHPTLSSKAGNIADVVNMFDNLMEIPDTSEAGEVIIL